VRRRGAALLGLFGFLLPAAGLFLTSFLMLLLLFPAGDLLLIPVEEALAGALLPVTLGPFAVRGAAGGVPKEPLVRTRDPVATKRRRLVRILDLFLATSYPPAWRARFRTTRDTPPRARDPDTARTMSSDTVGRGADFLGLLLGDLDTEDIVVVVVVVVVVDIVVVVSRYE